MFHCVVLFTSSLVLKTSTGTVCSQNILNNGTATIKNLFVTSTPLMEKMMPGP